MNIVTFEMKKVGGEWSCGERKGSWTVGENLFRKTYRIGGRDLEICFYVTRRPDETVSIDEREFSAANEKVRFEIQGLDYETQEDECDLDPSEVSNFYEDEEDLTGPNDEENEEDPEDECA